VVCLADYRRIRFLGAVRKGSREAVSATNIVGLILAILITIFLVVALVFPEKF
jgi:K+-transporting ATPase KdpF subunit